MLPGYHFKPKMEIIHLNKLNWYLNKKWTLILKKQILKLKILKIKANSTV